MLKEVLKIVKPTKKEIREVNKISKEIVDIVRNRVEREVVLAGSIAKGTWVKGNHDIDLYVLYDKNEGNISEKLINSLKGLKFKVIHGSRDYVRYFYKGFEVDIYPLYKLSSPSEAKNSVDASQFHVEYIKKKVTPRIADQIRILKMFLKASRVYGAETYISGFSGYVSELLMIYFKSFKKLSDFFDKGINPPIFIDIENYYKSPSEIRRSLSEPKLKSPIILIDPTYKFRNAAASLSYESFAKFIFNLRMFKRKPTLKFFKIKKIKIDSIERISKKRGTIIIKKKIKVGENKEVELAKIKSKLNKIISKIRNNGIFVYSYGFTDDYYVYVELETLKVSSYTKHYGPPVWVRKVDFDKFTKKWKKVYQYHIYLVSDKKRKSVIDFVKGLIKDEFGN